MLVSISLRRRKILRICKIDYEKVGEYVYKLFRTLKLLDSANKMINISV